MRKNPAKKSNIMLNSEYPLLSVRLEKDFRFWPSHSHLPTEKFSFFPVDNLFVKNSIQFRKLFTFLTNFTENFHAVHFLKFMPSLPYHTPALLDQSIKGLKIFPNGIYVDATFGGGGHSRAILQHLGDKGALFAFDRDLDALQNAPLDKRFTFVHSDYRFIPNFLKFHAVETVDGILADLGVSFHHFDDAQRGFSFRTEAPLDMRMNQAGGVTAADVINSYSQQQLTSIFKNYGELQKGFKIADAIVKARDKKAIVTTTQLLEVINPFIDPRKEKKELAQLFQAVRIEVNGELGSLTKLLENATRVLKPGGRFAIITYHSLEDRLVKNFFRSGNTDGEVIKDFYGNVETPWKLVGKPITPSDEEIERNPRARSAKLRIAELR